MGDYIPSPTQLTKTISMLLSPSSLPPSLPQFHLEKERVVVVVVSTTGDGDPPDTVVKFWRRLRKKTVPKDHLSGCRYALLGECVCVCMCMCMCV